MAEEITPAVQTEDEIQDVSLVDTPLSAPTSPDSPQPAADNATDDSAAADQPTEPEQPTSEDANTTEATAEPNTEAEPAAPDPTPQTDEQRREAARQAYVQRQQARRATEAQIDQHFAPRTADQFMEEGEDPVQAQLQAMQESITFNNERARIAELNATMQADAVNAMADFPVFNEKSPNYDPDFTKMVEQAYQTAARIETETVENPDGTKSQFIRSADVPLYDFYKQMNDIYARGASKASVQKASDVTAMLARTETPGSSSAARPKGPETLAEMEARLGDMPLT